MGQRHPASATSHPVAAPPSTSWTRLSRDEVQSVFSFLDWRSKLALARCNRTLRSDADSPMAWRDSDGPSAFSPAGVIELNLALLFHGLAVLRTVMDSLAARRGRVRLLFRHGASLLDRARCSLARLPVAAFQRAAESLPRLHGLGPLCEKCITPEVWPHLFRLAASLQRPLAEFCVDDFRRPMKNLYAGVMTRAVQMACTPALAPQLRALTLSWPWEPRRRVRYETYDMLLYRLPQLTQLECGAELWMEVVGPIAHGAFHGQLRSLSLDCTTSELSRLCYMLSRSKMAQLCVLHLLGVLMMDGDAISDKYYWGVVLRALPRLETLSLFLGSGAQVDVALTHLFLADAPFPPSLRTLQLRFFDERRRNPSRASVARALANCPQLPSAASNAAARRRAAASRTATKEGRAHTGAAEVERIATDVHYHGLMGPLAREGKTTTAASRAVLSHPCLPRGELRAFRSHLRLSVSAL